MLQQFPTPTRVSSTNHSHRILPGPTIGRIIRQPITPPPDDYTNRSVSWKLQPDDPYHTPISHDMGCGFRRMPPPPDDGHHSPDDSYQRICLHPDGYGSPDANYTTPDDGHHSPDDSYQTPDMGQGTPDAGYGSPDANYTTPDDGHHSPDDSYQTPDMGQGTPDDGYGTPDANYTSPDYGHHSPDDSYQTPDMGQGHTGRRLRFAGCKLHHTGRRTPQSRRFLPYPGYGPRHAGRRVRFAGCKLHHTRITDTTVPTSYQTPGYGPSRRTPPDAYPHRTMVTTAGPTKLRASIHPTPISVRLTLAITRPITDTTVPTSAIIRRTKASIHPTAISVRPTLATTRPITDTTVPTSVIIRRTKVSIHPTAISVPPTLAITRPITDTTVPTIPTIPRIWAGHHAGYGSPDANYTKDYGHSPDGNYQFAGLWLPHTRLRTPQSRLRLSYAGPWIHEPGRPLQFTGFRLSDSGGSDAGSAIRSDHSHSRCGILRRWGFALGWSGNGGRWFGDHRGGSDPQRIQGESGNPHGCGIGWDGIFVRLEDLAPGRYAYRAYGFNGVGETIGALRHFEQADEDMPGESALQGAEMADGWMRSPWFGAYREYGDGWIFHARLGWLYLSEDGQGGAWLWMESEGWLWTEAEVWPFLWKDRSQGWLYLIETSDGRRMIFDYSSGRIQPIR